MDHPKLFEGPDMKQLAKLYVGWELPLHVTLASEGLGWDPLI